MTNALNKTIIEGRVVRIPQLKQAANNTPYCNLVIAVNETFISEGKTKQTTNFITVALWNKTAIACCNYIKKGQWVRVEGKLRQATWIDENSMKHSRVEINCSSIDFLLLGQKKPQATRQKDAIEQDKEIALLEEI